MLPAYIGKENCQIYFQKLKNKNKFMTFWLSLRPFKKKKKSSFSLLGQVLETWRHSMLHPSSQRHQIETKQTLGWSWIGTRGILDECIMSQRWKEKVWPGSKAKKKTHNFNEGGGKKKPPLLGLF
jgi:hypothetical protein